MLTMRLPTTHSKAEHRLLASVCRFHVAKRLLFFLFRAISLQRDKIIPSQIPMNHLMHYFLHRNPRTEKKRSITGMTVRVFRDTSETTGIQIHRIYAHVSMKVIACFTLSGVGGAQ